MKESAQLLIVTGYSGAGKSSVLRALEDIGFFCIDNLPEALLDSFFQFVSNLNTNEQRVALGVDVRGGHDMNRLVDYLASLKKNQTCLTKIVFLQSTSTTILKRFQETRRKHPLADNFDLMDAIEQEKILLKPLSEIADLTIDTDQLNIHDLRKLIRKVFASEEKSLKMLVTLTSFGFKYGAPSEANFIFDVRSLPNPYFVENLKKLDGTSQEIKDYLFELPDVQEYWDKLKDFFLYAISKSYKEGRFFMHFSIGCTGGRHRSVAFIEELAKTKLDYVEFFVKHRDVYREG